MAGRHFSCVGISAFDTDRRYAVTPYLAAVEFLVTRAQSCLKARFPTESVYGPAPDAELRVITCGGAFDAATSHYLSNIVVYATEAT
jgi:hypothetical protein